MRRDFLDEAAKEGEKGLQLRHGGPFHGGPFGAVLVHKNRIVARGHNTVLKHKDPTCHAEINVIRKAAKKLGKIHLRGMVLYSSCEPCPMCFSAVHWARIPKVVYSSTISDVRRLGFNELAISCTILKKRGKSPVKIQRRKNPKCAGLLDKWKKLPAPSVY